MKVVLTCEMFQGVGEIVMISIVLTYFSRIRLMVTQKRGASFIFECCNTNRGVTVQARKLLGAAVKGWCPAPTHVSYFSDTII
jgi:hypothetical protein